MTRPARVTIASSEFIGVRATEEKDVRALVDLGFGADHGYTGLYVYQPRDETPVYAMYERLRDLGIPFSTHRTGGADYAIETFREKGRVHGKFRRINFFGNDLDEAAPFATEEF
ncbi:hypothetical protein DFR48_11579 [Ciceribacter lividus]|uniref:Uncharacterized protein n=1 Tax=Ciceribacter lividus TaxID=1197950 RepID=A0A6I7HI20_9HYPH|nr:hypothetical protein [Ciceribacter lividus]RCW20216.1 hypothetical protein DFR48_11579 [Ciceribacter lividus]